MKIDDPGFQDQLWITAICLRIEDMLKTHPEIDPDSLSLLLSAVRTGLKSNSQLLNRFKEGCSFIESDFFDDSDDEEPKEYKDIKTSSTNRFQGIYNHMQYSNSRYGIK
jgi:hypothetical protein